jgi:adenylate cyclase
MERRLAAILVADVVGYSRLMGEDEAETLATLKAHRKELIDPTVAKHNGRIVKLMGDGMLVEFASVVDALHCAVEIQRKMIDRNAPAPEDRRIEFRIGINVGDVMVDGDDIYGDGVNIAARLEGLADPGNVCVSGGVYDEVRNKVDLRFEDGGLQAVKNIAEPIRVYRVARAPVPIHDKPPPLPDKPSIAVLPFTNMSGDPEQEYFSDGITDDIITLLSRYRWIFVIARSSTFTYKDKPVDVKVVARELGVRYVLEGSVRKSGDRVRITAQLIDPTTTRHVWAERYDRQLDDVFDVQDEVTQAIVGAMEPELIDAEHQRAARKSPESLDAWDFYQRGLCCMYRFTKDGFDEARRNFDRSIQLDPNFSPAYAASAETRFHDALEGFTEEPAKTLDEALSLAKRAVSLDHKDTFAHFAVGRVQSLRREYEESIAELTTALDFNPSFAQAHLGLGFVFTMSGRMQEAIPHLEKAVRLSPRDPRLWSFLNVRALAHHLMGQYEDALEWASKAVRQPNAGHWTIAHVAAALGHLGRIEEARAAVSELLRRNPEFSCSFVRKYRFSVKNSADVENYLDGLRLAGLPE